MNCFEKTNLLECEIVDAARKVVKELPHIITCRGHETSATQKLKTAIKNLDDFYAIVFTLDVEEQWLKE